MKKKLIIPIGGLNYEIIFINPKKCKRLRNKEYDAFGHIDSSVNKIWIDNTLSVSNKNFVLLHEILHGCFSSLGQNSSEKIIRPLSHMVGRAIEEGIKRKVLKY